MTDSQTGMDARPLISAYQRLRRTGAKLILLSLGLALVAVIIIGVLQPAPPPPDFDRVGVHLLLDDGRNNWPVDLWPEHLAYADEIAGAGGLAVQVIRADDLDVTRWQTFVDLAESHNLTPVFRLATTVDDVRDVWRAPEPDSDGSYTTLATQYAEFIAALDVTAPHVILLNEPNNGHEWGGQPDAADYARFVVDVSAALRDAVPDVILLNAALDLYAPDTGSQPLGDTGLHHIDANTFMDAMFAAQPDIFTLFDRWNSHPYPAQFTAYPWEQSFGFDAVNDAADDAPQPPAGVVNRGINGYTWELWKLETFGVEPLPVIITETGWRQSPAGDPYRMPDETAALVDMALRGNYGQYPNAPRTGWTPLLTDERVEAVALFALNGHPDDWAHTSLLTMSADGTITGTTPAFDLIAAYHVNQ